MKKENIQEGIFRVLGETGGVILAEVFVEKLKRKKISILNSCRVVISF